MSVRGEAVTRVEGLKLQLHIDAKNGVVILEFGTTLSGLELGPPEAEIIAHLLLKHAHNAKMQLQGAKAV